MNNKIIRRGSNIGGLVRYLFGPGDSDEHRGQRVIAAAATLGIADGTRLDQPADWPRVLDAARDLDAHRRIAGVAPEDGWVWHCAVSLPPGERLDDAQWADIARTAVARLGFEADEATGAAGCRWIAVHHGPSTGGNDHIHIAVNLVREDLTIAAPGRDRMAMSRLCGDMERRYGLYVVPGRAGRGMPGYTRAAKERAQRHADRARAQGRLVSRADPETQTLARKVRAAATLAGSEAEFVAALAEAGILARPRYAKGDRTQVVGYSVALPAQASGTDRPIWYGGGKLAADLTLPKLRARWPVPAALATTARTTPPDALPAWQHANDVTAGTAAPVTSDAAAARMNVDAAPAAPPAGGTAGQWWDAVDHVEAAARELQNLPYGNTAAWSRAASDAAALLSLLADHIESDLPADTVSGRAADLAAAAHTLAWSAQTPRRPHPDAHHHAHHHDRRHNRRGDRRGAIRHGGPGRELADAARVVRAASRTRGSAEDVAMVVAIAALILAVLALVALIRAWHDHQQHSRQAAALDHSAGRCQYIARAQVGTAAPHWRDRRHGTLTDPQLARQARRAAATAKNLNELNDRTATLTAEARAGDGPAAAQLRHRAAVLAAAAAAEARLPNARAAATRAAEQHTLARQHVDELTAMAQRGRIALRLQGTTPARLANDLHTAQAELTAAADAARAARDHLDLLTRQAAAPFTRGRTAWRQGAAAAAHTNLTRRWNTVLAAAIETDVRTAAQRASGLNDETRTAVRLAATSTPHLFAGRPTNAADAHTALATLRTEQGIRATLPEHRAAEEQQQRLHHARAQRASWPTTDMSPDNPRRHQPPRPGPGRGGGLGR
ncbi:relaxase/mobilization nuclease domain-containing protein [Actinomadura citrea]|uniref:relaxase/mobilization nuclease domain-containing protein n=1 Tax=Actinomadura citrea TaxID=46158 RepID=UPI003CE484E5